MADSNVSETNEAGSALFQCAAVVGQIALGAAVFVMFVGSVGDHWAALKSFFSVGVWVNILGAAVAAALALVLVCSVFTEMDEFGQRAKRHSGLRFRSEQDALADALQRRLMPRAFTLAPLVGLAFMLMVSIPDHESNWTRGIACFVIGLAILIAMMSSLVAVVFVVCGFRVDRDGER